MAVPLLRSANVRLSSATLAPSTALLPSSPAADGAGRQVQGAERVVDNDLAAVDRVVLHLGGPDGAGLGEVVAGVDRPVEDLGAAHRPGRRLAAR